MDDKLGGGYVPIVTGPTEVKPGGTFSGLVYLQTGAAQGNLDVQISAFAQTEVRISGDSVILTARTALSPQNQSGTILDGSSSMLFNIDCTGVAVGTVVAVYAYIVQSRETTPPHTFQIE